MSKLSFIPFFAVISILSVSIESASFAHLDNDNDDSKAKSNYQSRLELWSRGDIYGHHDNDNGNDNNLQHRLEKMVSFSHLKLGPVRKVRKEFMDHNNNNGHYNNYQHHECLEFECFDFNRLLSMRGGGATANNNDQKGTYTDRLNEKLNQLSVQYGPDFQQAIELNEKEHLEDCEISCQSFYCASSTSTATNNTESTSTSFKAYNFGATPPEDFAGEFGFPLDLIKVSTGNPLFTSQEASQVIQTAEGEGVDKNEYQSGKYKLGGDWLVNLPKTRSWFNEKLQSTFFPLVTDLFPEIVSSTSELRAHSVSLLKYNSSHPRTDVHIDNGILAMTIAMTPQDDYVGGGTFFEHMEKPLEMDVGHITVRPGSVRHGGHKVTKGTRYILGAFLLIKDRVEHVRRLKNRGSELRRKQDLNNAAKHFEWALAINPKCTTCLKDWAEILMTQKKYTQAELKIREALRLLENRDSDALFSLGVILSEAGKDEESIIAYTQSVELNAEDAELCYNLGIKLGDKGDKTGEMTMYARATQVDKKFGGAWLNWGTTLAEEGHIDEAEVMFLNAVNCPEVKSKGMMNLAMVYLKQGENRAAQGDLPAAKDLAMKAGNYLDDAKVLLDETIKNGLGAGDEQRYVLQFGPLRLQSHRLVGSVLFGLKDFAACEEEFREATKNFPDIRGAWEMLARVLDLQGKSDEVAKVREQINKL